MDPDTVQTLLKELFCHLPVGWWTLLYQKEEHELGLPKALGRPRAEIKALLVNAGVCKETGNGFSIIKKVWDRLCVTLSSTIEVQICAKRIYVANRVDKYLTPAQQKKKPTPALLVVLRFL